MARETELSFPLAFISLFIFIPVNNKQLHLDDLKDFKCDKRTNKNQEEGKHFFRSLNKHTEYVKAQKESASHDSAMCLCSCLGKKLGEKKR